MHRREHHDTTIHSGATTTMIHQRPFRLGFFAYLEGEKPQAEVYADTLRLFQAADELGFDSVWVAQHHFGHHGGLPSPFVFFAALAERTRRIGFGTAVITLPLEDPIRVAEDAAVLEALHPGRLQLGLGTGLASPEVFETFGKAGRHKRDLYEEALPRLLAALDGQPLNEAGDILNPPGEALRARLWESPAALDRVADTARRGNGLLLSRIAIGAGLTPTHEVQLPMVETYTAGLPAGVAPRVGLSRTVYPSRTPDTALADITRGLEISVERARANGHGSPMDGLTMPELFTLNNVHAGTPDEVAASLAQEPLLRRGAITDLICQVQPGFPSLASTLDALELIATEVAPALGWRPSETRVRAAIGR